MLQDRLYRSSGETSLRLSARLDCLRCGDSLPTFPHEMGSFQSKVMGNPQISEAYAVDVEPVASRQGTSR